MHVVELRNMVPGPSRKEFTAPDRHYYLADIISASVALDLDCLIAHLERETSRWSRGHMIDEDTNLVAAFHLVYVYAIHGIVSGMNNICTASWDDLRIVNDPRHAYRSVRREVKQEVYSFCIAAC